MGRVWQWFLEHPPNGWVVFLEGVVRVLNGLLLLLGLAVLAWSTFTVVQIQYEPNSPQPPPAPSPAPTPSPAHAAVQRVAISEQAAAAAQTPAINHLNILNVPWFIYIFGLLGATTAFCAAVALVGVRLRNLGCVNSHIFFMCLLLTGQACAAVAFFVDKGWEHRLPDIDEKLKAFLMARLEVCQWVGVSLALLQLLTLLLSCTLQSVYVRAEEAAEDADEEAAWRRRPLLAAQQARHSPAAGTPPAPAAPRANDDSWSERMQQQYGLDTSQFTYRPGGRQEQGSQPPAQPVSSGKGCVVM